MEQSAPFVIKCTLSLDSFFVKMFSIVSLFMKWAGEDSNLRSASAADLQSAPFVHLGTCPQYPLQFLSSYACFEKELSFSCLCIVREFFLVNKLAEGLEPTTPSLQVRRSAELSYASSQYLYKYLTQILKISRTNYNSVVTITKC